MVDPLRMNPGSHLNNTLLGNTVESPEEEPFMGTDKGPQSTARNKFSRNEEVHNCEVLHLSTGIIRFSNKCKYHLPSKPISILNHPRFIEIYTEEIN